MPWMKPEKVIAIRERAERESVIQWTYWGRPYVGEKIAAQYAKDYSIRKDVVRGILSDHMYMQGKYYPEGSVARKHFEEDGPPPYKYYWGVPIEELAKMVEVNEC